MGTVAPAGTMAEEDDMGKGSGNPLSDPSGPRRPADFAASCAAMKAAVAALFTLADGSARVDDVPGVFANSFFELANAAEVTL